MKFTNWMMVAALLGTTGLPVQASPGRTQVQKGYVCAVSLSTFGIARRGTAGALAFNLTSAPDCEGTWLPINYACSSSPRAAINIDFCARSAAFSAADQALLQAQLLHAAERKVLIDVVRGNCIKEESEETCFVGARLLNIPFAEEVSRGGD